MNFVDFGQHSSHGPGSAGAPAQENGPIPAILITMHPVMDDIPSITSKQILSYVGQRSFNLRSGSKPECFLRHLLSGAFFGILDG